MTFGRVICEYERKAEDQFKMKQCNNINNNQYNILENDTLDDYGKYNQPWSLDSAASGHYCGKSTRINNRKVTPPGGGIQVGVANNQLMQQIEERELPFDWLPTAANDVQVFPSMQSPLIGCGKLATNGCGIRFDNEKGSVVNGATKDKMKAFIATSGDNFLLAAPFDNQSLTWKTAVPGPGVGPVQPIPLNLAQNIQRLRTKEQLVEYLHRAAGHPVKKP
jgi:hypothetical protein